MLNRTVSILFLAYICITCALMFPLAVLIWLITRPFDHRLRVLHQFTCLWGAHYIWVMPVWKLTLTGRNKIPKTGNRIYVSNHQSQLDILVAFNLFTHFKWVSKIEIFRLPFVGWNMTLNRYIRLKRGDKESIRQMMADCEASLRQGNPVYMFPEGTRSPDGNVKPFKPGAFELAHKLKLPIQPIALSGTRRALPKYSLNFHGRHHLRMDVLDEIPYSAFSHLSVSDTAEKVRHIIMAHVDAHQGDAAGTADVISQTV
ncbi:MAG: 1-acyl-sn-glycerol-3-phosphate acyltransferase [Deltaproteobacteria bacterium]|nr:MAG: 1-acyl-sn-glycerol-3-phosphate acyltransferase [Deltaproteobacteria bacterium]